MSNLEKLFIAGCLGSMTFSAHVTSTVECCIHEEPEIVDEASLEVCDRQKVTAVLYDAAGSPVERVNVIWDGDAPNFTKDGVHRFVNGWK